MPEDITLTELEADWEGFKRHNFCPNDGAALTCVPWRPSIHMPREGLICPDCIADEADEKGPRA